MGIKQHIINLTLLVLPLSLQASREVEHIEIVESGHYSGYSKEDPYNYRKLCKSFQPTQEQLIDYFSMAQEANYSGDWLNEYYSPCVASGTVTFKDKSYGTWGINDAGYGGMTFKDKANYGKRKYFLNLKSKWLEE
ncbi:hypothetical protein ACGVWS_15200 [Enterobacteriaceae bacterium LUAb1]